MQIVIDIPKSLYANLQKIQNGSIAAKRILECVRNGKRADVPDTNVGEYINREDALMCLTGEWTELTDEIIHRFIKRIKNLPLMVLPKQRTGRWNISQNGMFAECSACNNCHGEYGRLKYYNYCPNCGAKMQEVEE